MTRVTHADRRTVDRDRRSNMIVRIDPRLVSLPKGQVYFVPESRLINEKDADTELKRYRDANAQTSRS